MCEVGERRWGEGGERGGRERWVVTRVCEGGDTRIKGEKKEVFEGTLQYITRIKRY